MAQSKTPVRTALHSLDGIPSFQTEAEEAAFWDTHEIDDALLDRFGAIPEGVLPPTRARTTPVAIRFDADVLHRVRALARKKHKGYQTLVKEFVIERLYEEEKREGLLPSNDAALARPKWDETAKDPVKGRAKAGGTTVRR